MSSNFDSSPLLGYVLHYFRLERDGRSFPMFIRPSLVAELELALQEPPLRASELERERTSGKVAEAAALDESADSPEAPERCAPVPSVVDDSLLSLLVQGRGRPANEEAFIRQFEEIHAFNHSGCHVHLVLRGREVLKAIARAVALRDTDTRRSEVEQLRRLARRGAYRRVESPTSSSDRWTNAVEELHRNHPQFREVTQYVSNCVELARRTFGLPKITPILLVGPPGVGKSTYATDLADALGVPTRSQSMENAQTTALMLGTERHWANAAPGLLFEEVVLGKVANPLILIEEIDKCPTSGRSDYNPINSFHSILEPQTAMAVRDAGMDMAFDASLAIYLATANSLEPLPLSIQSRFRIFTILPPSGAVALDLAHAVVVRAVRALGVSGFCDPTASVTNKLAHLTPREITQCLPDAVGRAVSDGRSELRLEDFPAGLLGVSMAPAPPWLH